MSTVNIGGYSFVDLRRQEPWNAIGAVNGIAIHHTVSDFDHYPENDLDAIMAILRYHVEVRHWPGIGYHILIGDDGTKYLVGALGTQRAHVKYRNHELWGIGLLGSYSEDVPPQAQTAGCADAIVALRDYAGKPHLVWKGHKEWADARSPTACPGDKWPEYKLDVQAGVRRATEATLDPTQRMIQELVDRSDVAKLSLDGKWAEVLAKAGAKL